MKSSALVVAFAPLLVFAALDANIKAKGKKYFGTSFDPNVINVSSLANIVKAEFGCVTPENSAKWDALEPNQNQFNWGNFDTLVNFATSNGKAVRGHTLVWHAQLPQWVKNINNAATLTSVLQNHVKTVVTRYKGKIIHWDVVNECLSDSTTGLRSSVFYDVLGEQFIDIAFKAAREADPNAKLYINDYNLDYPGNKLTGMVNLISRLKSRGVPIDGVGSQAHLSVSSSTSNFATALNTLHNTGLDVAITELDIGVSSSSQFSQQQTSYNAVVKACMNLPRCVGITTWGVSDNYSWRSSSLPLLWDGSFQKKPAYTGADNAITGSSGSTTGGSTSTSSSSGGGCTVAKYGQCGGSGYTGCKTCASGSTCTYSNEWYSQCL